MPSRNAYGKIQYGPGEETALANDIIKACLPYDPSALNILIGHLHHTCWESAIAVLQQVAGLTPAVSPEDESFAQALASAGILPDPDELLAPTIAHSTGSVDALTMLQFHLLDQANEGHRVHTPLLGISSAILNSLTSNRDFVRTLLPKTLTKTSRGALTETAITDCLHSMSTILHDIESTPKLNEINSLLWECGFEFTPSNCPLASAINDETDPCCYLQIKTLLACYSTAVQDKRGSHGETISTIKEAIDSLVSTHVFKIASPDSRCDIATANKISDSVYRCTMAVSAGQLRRAYHAKYTETVKKYKSNSKTSPAFCHSRLYSPPRVGQYEGKAAGGAGGDGKAPPKHPSA